LSEFFAKEIEPVLTPLGLDPARPFPRIQNKSLNFIVRLSGKDAFGRDAELAVVQVPRSLPRILRIPADAKGATYFVFLSAVVSMFIDRLFNGMAVEGAWQFRVTRNSDLFVDDEEVDNLLRAIEGELAERRYGAAVRLETSKDCPEDITEFLLRHFALSREDLYQVRGPVNLNRLMAIYDLIDRPDLKYPSFAPSIPKRLVGREDLLGIVREGDLLLHHPYETFGPVIDLLRHAANDPHVLAIKQTLYRTGAQSPIVDALVAAARAGKEVTVVIELMARFDEAANIGLATRLQEAGAHVMYGVVGYKTHAKLIMVVRREGDHLRRYCHLGTGNYHPNTARVYTDYGLFTCNEAIGEDVHELFLQLTSPTRAATMQKILQSPFTLHDSLIEKTKREIAFARSGRLARIIVKLNALLEPMIIQALYQASMAGVKVELIVRGMCSLRPGVPGLSDNIKVRSVVGRFLEHSRVYYFHNDGNAEVYCASADWMERNFFRRIEVAFPIDDKAQRERVISELEIYLADNEQAWLLSQDGTYQRPERRTGGVNAQRSLLRRYAEGLD
jgi:polyphosphate kinase